MKGLRVQGLRGEIFFSNKVYLKENTLKSTHFPSLWETPQESPSRPCGNLFPTSGRIREKGTLAHIHPLVNFSHRGHLAESVAKGIQDTNIRIVKSGKTSMNSLFSSLLKLYNICAFKFVVLEIIYFTDLVW